jgi:hypothetical protein
MEGIERVSNARFRERFQGLWIRFPKRHSRNQYLLVGHPLLIINPAAITS